MHRGRRDSAYARMGKVYRRLCRVGRCARYARKSTDYLPHTGVRAVSKKHRPKYTAAAEPSLSTATSEQRKTIPMASGLLDYFKDALAAGANVSSKGSLKQNIGEPMHWARTKSADHADC